ncbi:uncharacterized protein UV8b_06707 [Ustilaginoidea virens]|uniref:Uncharacterized protein n=1 Tax=Ustilaginoidea virens TaxID=1159556 RepID=A0A8E5HVT1_USTVR|nr:uncharacterized protein UV8b_06707 [Ustilaginoidea virens]QUC22466.1 hypothetical protein UV8b_06707 [Ustilaginoidea virens]
MPGANPSHTAAAEHKVPADKYQTVQRRRPSAITRQKSLRLHRAFNPLNPPARDSVGVRETQGDKCTLKTDRCLRPSPNQPSKKKNNPLGDVSDHLDCFSNVETNLMPSCRSFTTTDSTVPSF